MPDEPDALVLSPLDNSLWVLAQKRLYQFDAATSLVGNVDLKSLTQKLEDPKGLLLDSNDGSLWVSAEKSLLHIDSQGKLLLQWRLSDKIEAVQIGLDSKPWILTKKELLSLSAQGDVVQRLNVSKLLKEPDALGLDLTAGILWFADEKQLYQWNPTANQSPKLISTGKFESLAVDGISGRVWVTTDSQILGFDRAGNSILTTALSASYKESEFFAFDTTTQSLWLGAKKVVAHLSTQGVVLGDVKIRSELEALAVAPLRLVPQVELISPINGVITNNPLMSVRVKLSALCNGNVCDAGAAYYAGITLNATLNNVSIGNLFVVNGAEAVFTPTTRLPDGANTLTISATDSFGHVSNAISASFVVDTIPPTIDVSSPTTTLTRVAVQTISGVVSEPGTLTINGQFVSFDAERKFNYPVTLIEGINSFELIATDYAGNSTHKTLTLTLDTIAPVFGSITPAEGSVVVTAQLTVQGSVDDSTVSVTLNELSALSGTVSSANPASFAFNVTLKTGANTLTLVAQDPAGNQATKVIHVTYSPPGGSSGQVAVTNLTSGQALNASSTLVAGSFSGPSNTGITVNGMIATVVGDKFYVNNVPLNAGDNTITVVANSIDGEVGRQQFTVSSAGSSLVSVEQTTPQTAKITTFAGNGLRGFGGDGAAAAAAQLNYPSYLAKGPNGSFYFVDSGNRRIRRIDAAGVITTFAGNGLVASTSGTGDGGPATQASFSYPGSIAVGPDGSVYITEEYRIRRVNTNGVISTVAGSDYGYSGDGGSAIDASFGGYEAIAVDFDGSIYVADMYNCRLRKIDLSGIVNTIAGTGECGYTGDGGQALDAQLGGIGSVVVGADKSIYVVDVDSSTIRRIAPNGVISTVAGSGSYGYGGDGGLATQAQFGYINDISFDALGNLYIADYDNNVVRRVDRNGIVTTIAGDGNRGYAGDGGSPLKAQFADLSGVTVSSSGTLYIVDSSNQRVRSFNAMLPSGDIPANATGFRIVNNTGKNLTKIEADFNGDGAIDATVYSESDVLQYVYPGPGVYTAKFLVTDESAQTYNVSYVVVIEDIVVKDQMLRGTYTLMLDRLRVGNVEGALRTIADDMQDNFGTVFRQLQPNLGAIVDQLGVIKRGTIGDDIAEYVLVREQNGAKRAFLIYMIRDHEGVWRIGGM